jgi:hypothetical protein
MIYTNTGLPILQSQRKSRIVDLESVVEKKLKNRVDGEVEKALEALI